MASRTRRNWLRAVLGTRAMNGKRPTLSLHTLEDRTVPTGVPELVRDIDPGTYSSGIHYPVVIGGTTFFVTTAFEGGSTFALWKSDGTAAGTVLLKDFSVAGMNTIPTNLTNVSGTLFFRGYTPSHGSELWKSDGTPAGTVLVKDIYPGTTTGQYGTFPNGSGPNNLASVGDKLFFTADDGIHGRELWVSDGTEAGTVLAADLNGTVASTTRNMTDVNGDLFFVAEERSLWKVDGTTLEPSFIKDFASIIGLTSVNQTLFFTAWDSSGGSGRELWKSDGTAAGTVLVKDINPGTEWSDPVGLTNVNGTLYFTAIDGSHGRELWRSNGTAAGTSMVRDINPGSGWSATYLTNVDGTVYFCANDGANGGELWKSNGTVEGTVLVKDINPGATSSGPFRLTGAGGRLFLIADDGTHGREVWTSDGTAAGTTLVKDIYSGTLGYYPRHLAGMNGTLFFVAHDGMHGYEPWTSDGTPAGTALVKDVNARGIGSNPRALADLNDSLFFAVGNALWTSDGTAAGTVPFNTSLVADSEMLDVNGMLYFSAWDGATSQYGLWKSDGTAAGTALVRSLAGSSARNLTDVNGTLFFTFSDENGEELWKSDGTVAGTVMVKDIFPGNAPGYQGYWQYYGGGPYSSSPSSLTNVNGTLYFTATDATHGHQLWKSDGTEAGTILYKDFSPGGASSIESLANVNGTLYISADDGTHGVELWRSDGTVAGTVLVRDIVPGSGSSSPTSLTSVSGTLYFRASDGTHGAELWKSDGTAAGTVLVADINPGVGSSSPQSLAGVDGTLYFSADDGAHGMELWMSEGTAATTTLVGDINPGAASSSPNNLTVVNGTLFFSADDGTHGTELWGPAQPPTLSIADVSQAEGNSGAVAAQFTVQLSAPSTEPISVRYSTANGTAVAGIDYTATAGTLMFEPGQTSQTISVPILGDRLGEPDETFVVNLDSPINATIFDEQGLGTIRDDEPRIRVSDVMAKEGNAGQRSFAFTVDLSVAYDVSVTVDWTTANGTATAGSDYVAASGTLTVPVGATTGTIGVVVFGDLLFEPDETFEVRLANPGGGAVVADGTGVGTIVNDDDMPRMNINDVSKLEGRNGYTLFVFTVTLSAPSTAPVTVRFATADGTARAGSDYEAASGTLTFAPGETTKTVTIRVKGDRTREADETFTVNLSGATNALLVDGTGLGTVLNDD
jgi:ELWxxDGT repeat protein